MELGTILQIVLPPAAAGLLVLGGASRRLARILGIRQRPFRWGDRHSGATPRIALVHSEPPHLNRRSRPSVGRLVGGLEMEQIDRLQSQDDLQVPRRNSWKEVRTGV